MKTIVNYFSVLALSCSLACVGTISDSSAGDDGDAGPEEPSELTGAGGRDLTEFWPSIELPFSNNVKMLNFEMMRNEVQRATGHSWLVDGIDQWDRNRSVLGGADYIDTWFEDRNPSQQKIVTWRKMAFTVCDDLVAEEQGQPVRTVFAIVDPAEVIDIANPAVSDQVKALFRRFFLEDATPTAVTESLGLLVDLQNVSNPAGQRQAWRGLCAGYLASMRFLTY